MPLSTEKKAQLQHEIVIQLAQALLAGWEYSTAPAHSSYNRPAERPYPSSGVVTQNGEMHFVREKYVTEGSDRVVYGVDTVITAAQYREAERLLPLAYQQAIRAYLTPRAASAPSLSQEQLAAFEMLAGMLGLYVTELKRVPTGEPRRTVADLFAPRLDTRRRRIRAET